MAKSSASFKPGESGNPKGRPPKNRALTEILERAGSKTLDVDGRKVGSKRLVAAMVWEGATTRRVTFPSGEHITLTPYHWLELVKWLYVHIDGPAKQELDVQSDATLTIEYVNDWRNETG